MDHIRIALDEVVEITGQEQVALQMELEQFSASLESVH